MSESAVEFSRRLSLAIEGHPRAPDSEFGRLTWLQRELESSGRLKVSVNTVHKWVRGLSLPRPDKVRTLSRVLNVDEVWLALGQSPAGDRKEVEQKAAEASGAVLLIAGLIEVSGGKVSFPAKGTREADLLVSLDGDRFGLIVPAARATEAGVSFIVTEPVGQNRIVGAVPGREQSSGYTLAVDLFDLTRVPRKNLGGFSVVEIARNRAGDWSAPGLRSFLAALVGAPMSAA